MADDPDLPEQLVEQIADAAKDLNFQDAEVFRSIALDNLASFRDHQRRDDRSGFSIPRSYAQRPELFLVFDAFVGVFLEPVELALSNLDLLDRLEGPEALAFARFGEGVGVEATLTLNQRNNLREANNELRNMAQGIGKDLFGSDFDLRRFSRSDAEDFQG
jgi:hypothetical protein